MVCWYVSPCCSPLCEVLIFRLWTSGGMITQQGREQGCRLKHFLEEAVAWAPSKSTCKGKRVPGSLRCLAAPPGLGHWCKPTNTLGAGHCLLPSAGACKLPQKAVACATSPPWGGAGTSQAKLAGFRCLPRHLQAPIKGSECWVAGANSSPWGGTGTSQPRLATFHCLSRALVSTCKRQLVLGGLC